MSNNETVYENKGSLMRESQVIGVLLVLGWILTVVGQIQVLRKRRAGFATWIVANILLIARCVRKEPWWSIGMYATNFVVCAWSFRSSGREHGSAMRSLFANRSFAW